MGLDIQGHLMTLNKCVKFQSNSIHSVWEKDLHAKVWPSCQRQRQRGRRGDYIISPISSNRRAKNNEVNEIVISVYFNLPHNDNCTGFLLHILHIKLLTFSNIKHIWRSLVKVWNISVFWKYIIKQKAITRVQNILVNGEQFLHLSQCFQESFAAKVSENNCVCLKGLMHVLTMDKWTCYSNQCIWK